MQFIVPLQANMEHGEHSGRLRKKNDFMEHFSDATVEMSSFVVCEVWLACAKNCRDLSHESSRLLRACAESRSMCICDLVRSTTGSSSSSMQIFPY